MNVGNFAPSYVFRGLHSDGEVASVCTKVLDGDTILCHLVLPLYHIGDVWLRLRGVKAPEIWQPGGKEARDFLASLVLGKPVWVETFKRPSDDEEQMTFVRFVADVGIDPDAEGNLVDIAVVVVAAGHATRIAP